MEVWKDIKGYEGLYQVSNLGNVKSYDRWFQNHSKKQFLKGRLMSQNLTGGGYLSLMLHKNSNGERFKVHRLVAMAFVENINNKPFVNHKNGIKTDNRAENLEWCTQKENIQHAFDTGLNHKGEKHGKAILTDKQAKYIKYTDLPHLELANMFGVNRTLVTMIKNNKRWKHI